MEAFIIMKETKRQAFNDKVTSTTVKPVVVFDSMNYAKSWLHTMYLYSFREKFIHVEEYTDNSLTIRYPISVIHYYVVVVDHI